MPQPFDAVLLVSFGGPGGRHEIRPFLRNVLRARRIPERRLEAVVRHYEQFDGVSPLTEITMRQAAGLRERLAADGPALPTYVGMRNWHPFLEDTLAEMARAGVRRALALTLAAHHSYSSCGQYKQNASTALRTLRQAGHLDIELTYVARWHDHPGFVRANVRHIEQAIGALPPALRAAARIVFTAHSIPSDMARQSRYEADLLESARLIAAAAGRTDWALVYQSRSGRPQDPWLGPDVCDYLRAQSERGLEAVVLSPARLRRGPCGSAVRPRPRSGRNLPGGGYRNAAGCGRQRRPRLSRHAGRCGARGRPALWRGPAAVDRAGGPACADRAAAARALSVIRRPPSHNARRTRRSTAPRWQALPGFRSGAAPSCRSVGRSAG